MCQTDELQVSQMKLDESSQSNLESLVATAQKLLQSKAQMRNRLGQFVPDPRWTTYDAALSQYVPNFCSTSISFQMVNIHQQPLFTEALIFLRFFLCGT